MVLSMILMIYFSGCVDQSDTIQENEYAPVKIEIEPDTYSQTPIPTKSITNAISTSARTPLATPTINPKKITYGLDLLYEVPYGWTEDRSDTNGITLSGIKQNQPGTDFYGVSRYSVMVLPSQPLSGSLADTYSILWRQIVLDFLTTDIKPLPMQLRLKSGYMLAYDGGNMKMVDNGESMDIVFYVIAAEDRAVPILAVYTGWDESLETTIKNFFDTATIRGASPSKAPLFTEDQMVGKWTASDASLDVDSSGNYVGDARAYGSTYQFLDDGTFSINSASISTGDVPLKSSSSGSWSIDDGFLVLDNKETGKISKLRIWGIGQSPRAGHTMLRLDGYPGQKMELVVPRRSMSGEWYESR